MNEQKMIIQYINNEIELQGIKQKDIANYIGMGEASLSKCLNGKQELTIQNLVDICRYLDIDFYNIFNEHIIHDTYNVEVIFNDRCSREAAIALQAINNDNAAFRIKKIQPLDKNRKK